MRWEGPLCPSPWGLCSSAVLRGNSAHWPGLLFPEPEIPLACMGRRSSKGKAGRAVSILLRTSNHSMDPIYYTTKKLFYCHYCHYFTQQQQKQVVTMLREVLSFTWRNLMTCISHMSSFTGYCSYSCISGWDAHT